MNNITIKELDGKIFIEFNDCTTPEKCSLMCFYAVKVENVKMTNDAVEINLVLGSIRLTMDSVKSIQGAIPTDLTDIYKKIVGLM